MEQVFGTPEREDIDTTTTISPNIVELIVNRNFGNTFHHQNGKISPTTHTKRQAVSINPGTTINKETSHLHN